jgi:hypothetical protein
MLAHVLDRNGAVGLRDAVTRGIAADVDEPADRGVELPDANDEVLDAESLASVGDLLCSEERF